MVSIVILNWNTRDLTLQCLHSIAQHTADAAHEIVLIDNGSSDQSSEAFHDWQSSHPAECVTLIRNERNRGFAAGVNQGVGAAKGDHICLLNSDTEVTAGWLSAMLTTLGSMSDRRVRAVGPLTNARTIPREQGNNIAGQARPDFLAARRLPFFCVLLSTQTMKEIGPMDEQFGLGNYEDDDYCTRLRNAGYSFAVCGGAFVYHHVGQTFVANNVDSQKLLEENKAKFRAKWLR